jgi:hypothetical protein
MWKDKEITVGEALAPTYRELDMKMETTNGTLRMDIKPTPSIKNYKPNPMTIRISCWRMK